MPSKKELSGLMYQELLPEMTKLGFKGKKSDFSFELQVGDWHYEFIGEIRMYHVPILDFYFRVSCRTLEEVLEKALSYAHLTFFFQLHHFFKDSKQQEDFYIEADDYFGIVAESFLELLREKILPLLELAQQFDQLDLLMNEHPSKHHFLFPSHVEQAQLGLIIKQLVDPAGLDDIFDQYGKALKNQEQHHSVIRGNLKALEKLYHYLKNQ